MAEFDIQIQVPVFLGVMAAGLRSRQICLPPPTEVAGVSLIVHQIEFTASELRHDQPARYAVFHQSHGTTQGMWAEGFQTQLAQDVVVHVSTTAAVLAHPNQTPPAIVALPLTVVVDLDFVADGTPTMTSSISQVQWRLSLPPLPPTVDPADIKREVEVVIRRAFPSFTQPLDIVNLLMGGNTPTLNVGMTVSQDGTLLVFRAETGAGTGYVDWRWGNFFSGIVTDRLAGAQWGLWIDHRVVESMFQTAVWQAVAAEAGPEVDLISVGSAYSGTGGRAQVTTTVHAHVDLPDPLGNPYVEVPVRAELSVAAGGELTIDLRLPDIRAIARSMIAGIDAVLRRLLGPVWAFVRLPIDSAIADLKPPVGDVDLSGLHCTEIEPLHQRCTRRLPASSFGGTQVRIGGLSAQPDGLLLTATLRSPVTTPAKLRTSFRPFAWTPPQISCGSADAALAAAFAEHAEDLAPLQAQIYLEADGTAPAWYCALEVLNDPLDRFGHVAVDSDRLPATVTVRVPNPGPVYAADPYPVDVLVRTTIGSRLIRIPPAPPLTEQDIRRLKAVVIAMIADCKLLVRSGRFDLRWLIDPPFDRQFRQRWQLAAEHVRPGTKVALLADGGPMVSVAARAGTVTKLSAMVSPGAGLSLVRDEIPEGAAQAALAIRQQLLEVTASVAVEAPVAAVLASAVWTPNGVAAVLSDGIAAYDVGSAARPRAVGRWYVDGVRRALNWWSGLLVVTEDGLFNVDAERRLRRVGPAEEPAPLLDAASGPGAMYVLTADGLQVRSRSLSRRSSVAVHGARSLLRVGGRLLVGGAAGVAVYRMTGTGLSVDPVVSVPELDVTHLAAVIVEDEGAVLATVADGTWRSLVVDERDRVSVVAEYPERPWFAGAARLGDTFVLVDDRGGALEVLTAGVARPVGSDATTELPAGFAFASWTDLGPERAVGTLHGAQVTVVGPIGEGGVTDGTFPLFGAAHYAPPLPMSDAVSLISLAGSSFRLRFGEAVRDVVLHLASVASRLTFPPGTPVVRVSGDPTFSLSATTVTGAVAGTLDSGGTLRIYGRMTELSFTADPVFADGTVPDGFYLQVGAVPA
ncbi:hypothetical protein SAMN05443287_11178 [Micromonospora phaseoli]|uniref:Uncharacterized protein n=1 Tax=Micromonospora phaseoli TaxID=1144548 RepID=A0A1H7D123_9ACTN|nr:hypothetical protein [Micromonospora phaseoli]PZV98063.1 hypothetical protein CLV64_105331 [Micromonospora phaseoli]GIJ77828.1 hypothetical protein Xph01_22600 [Micromonospora phaseoli]SEJ95114.1 hypothetical protein SAMN05443287_11178 [Micromonospora phaseoli]